jgi:hypothetical protein
VTATVGTDSKRSVNRPVVRTVHDVDGCPLEVQDSVAAADSNALRYEVAMR